MKALREKLNNYRCARRCRRWLKANDPEYTGRLAAQINARRLSVYLARAAHPARVPAKL